LRESRFTIGSEDWDFPQGMVKVLLPSFD